MSSSKARRIHIEAWQTSGMSQAAYCREHGLNAKTFGNWVRKHRAGQVIRSPALVPVTIKPMPMPAEYDASSRSGRSCVGAAADDFSALAGGVVEVSLIANPGKIWLMVEPVDMRRGIDGLSVLVEQGLQRSPCAGSAFVFCNRAGNRIKVLLWDGTGVWLCQRRLHQGRFVWGRSDTGGMELTSSQWEWLIAGVDWHRLGLQSCARKYS